MEKAWKKLKQQFEENPIGCIIVASFATVSTAKLIDALANASSRRSWAKEVDRRDRKDRRDR